MKKYFKKVFIVLVYRNTTDLKDYFECNEFIDSKVIVVNSFYDNQTEQIFKHLAEKYKADFISVPNQGYGKGNNIGIEYALNHYQFDFLIVSNADILIERMDDKSLVKHKNFIIAPKILTSRGKNQNPSTPFTPSRFRERLVAYIYKYNHRHMIYVYYMWSRISKIVYYTISKFHKRIFSPHGAFIIIPYEILTILHPLFNEKMFLFFEEHHLGQLARKFNVKVLYTPEVIIRHKEDGSVAFLSEGIYKYMRQSYLEYYSFWFR